VDDEQAFFLGGGGFFFSKPALRFSTMRWWAAASVFMAVSF
jgi:hypothetical protein